MNEKILVAGVGNIFLGDDGFGVEVARRVAARSLPREVRVGDFGIRGVHLAYELLDPIDLLVIADAMPQGDQPGTLYLIEPNVDDVVVVGGAHGMDLTAVFASVKTLGGVLPRIRIVGCEPLDIEERIGLSAPVANAVEPAVALVLELVTGELRKENS